MDDSPIAGYFAHSLPGLRFCGPIPGTEADYALMVRIGNRLLRDRLNTALDDIESDGTLEAFRKLWLG